MKKRKRGRKCRSVPFLRSALWKDLRASVIERDGGRCYLSGATENLVVHHILHRRDYKGLQAEPMNLITLSQAEHWKVHRGSSALVLFERLRRERPEQWAWLVQQMGLGEII